MGKYIKRELEIVPSPAIERITEAIALSANDLYPSGRRKLADVRDSFRVQIGSYRVVYHVTPGTVTVPMSAHRSSLSRR